jgi:catechol 2,3-dioxygenase-like lactoylglutathione lyase family enzyme
VAPLDRAGLIAFVPTTDLPRARRFFEDTLGLRHLGDDAYASSFDVNGTVVRVVAVHELRPAHFTVLGWIVDDIAGAVDTLSARGVGFERFDGMGQDERGVWTAPGGDLVAWFKDPDGNTLSLTQLAPDR